MRHHRVSYHPVYVDQDSGRRFEKTVTEDFLPSADPGTQASLLVDACAALRWVARDFKAQAQAYSLLYVGCVKIYGREIGPVDAAGLCATRNGGIWFEWKCDTGLYRPSRNAGDDLEVWRELTNLLLVVKQLTPKDAVDWTRPLPRR